MLDLNILNLCELNFAEQFTIVIIQLKWRNTEKLKVNNNIFY